MSNVVFGWISSSFRKKNSTPSFSSSFISCLLITQSTEVPSPPWTECKVGDWLLRIYFLWLIYKTTNPDWYVWKFPDLDTEFGCYFIKISSKLIFEWGWTILEHLIHLTFWFCSSLLFTNESVFNAHSLSCQGELVFPPMNYCRCFQITWQWLYTHFYSV